MTEQVDLPVAISVISGRYFLFSADVVAFLRRQHHICGVLIGSIPQIPQQNVFLGLPLELMPEEAFLLVEQSIAFLVDDARAHDEGLRILDQRRRQMYIESLKAQGTKMAESQVKVKEQRRARAMREKGLTPPVEDVEKTNTLVIDPVTEDGMDRRSLGAAADDDALYDVPETAARVSLRGGIAQPDLFITPTTSQGLFPTPPGTPSPGPSEEELHISKAEITESEEPSPNDDDFQESPSSTYSSKGRLSIRGGASQADLVTSTSSQPILTISPPPSYPLFAYLHSKGYFLSPGLRFGCQYLVYPGDPLRFHSHFLASGVGWDEEMDLMDIVGGGRLGTGVKKGFLFGGSDPSKDHVRAFSVEWAGM